jgi:integral membrane protein
MTARHQFIVQHVMHYLTTQLGRLRLLAFVEGVSLLLILFVSMPLKYFYNTPGPNKVIGMVHGLLFLLYVLAVIQAKIEWRWSGRKTALALLASVIPFGTFWADARLFREPKES